MKSLTRAQVATPPEAAGVGDGLLAFAADHLTAIKYPNRLADVAVVGRLRDWHRSFLLRPKFGGRFLFLMYPRDNASPETLIRRELVLQAFNSAPALLDVTIPAPLRLFDRWEWRLIKTRGADEEEDRIAEQDGLALKDGMLTGRSADELASYAEREGSLATLLYQVRPAMTGQIRFAEERAAGRAKIAIWSCHQPYASSEGKAIVKEQTERILSWYHKLIEPFAPHMIWILGDSVYSDGTSSLDFVAQVYDRKGWQESDAMRKDLLSLYRLNYRHHWSFEPLQAVMRAFPHLGMWDDHEIRDGYGSDERDFSEHNAAIKQIAAQAAEEYLFQYSPKLRSESTRSRVVDNHQAYVSHCAACFIFDGRNSRRYGEDMSVPSEVPLLASALAGLLIGMFTGGIGGAVAGTVAGSLTGAELASEIVDVYRWHNPGEVVSDLQLEDFERFCNHLKGQAHVKYLILGNAVPFIYILDMVESIASESAIAATDTGRNMRDDIRDSWHSPANRRQLFKLIDILRDLHRARSDLEIVNLSGDIHLSNAFVYHPDGFRKPLYQVTSSALTNDPPDAEGVLGVLSADGPLDASARSDLFGGIKRLWHEGAGQNFLTLDASAEALVLHLHVFEKEDPSAGSRDRILTIRPDQGYTLT